MSLRKDPSRQGPRSPRGLPPGSGALRVCAPEFVSHSQVTQGLVSTCGNGRPHPHPRRRAHGPVCGSACAHGGRCSRAWACPHVCVRVWACVCTGVALGSGPDWGSPDAVPTPRRAVLWPGRGTVPSPGLLPKGPAQPHLRPPPQQPPAAAFGSKWRGLLEQLLGVGPPSSGVGAPTLVPLLHRRTLLWSRAGSASSCEPQFPHV